MAIILQGAALEQAKADAAFNARIAAGEKIAREELARSEGKPTTKKGKSRKKEPAPPPPGLDALVDVATPLTITWKDREKKQHTRKLMIEPMRVGTLMEFCKQADPFIDELLGYFKTGEILLGSLFSKHGEQFIKSVAIAAEVEEEVVRALEFDALMNLAGKVIIVNVDFFRRRLRAILALWGQAIQHAQALSLAGSTTSPLLPATAADGSKF